MTDIPGTIHLDAENVRISTEDHREHRLAYDRPADWPRAGVGDAQPRSVTVVVPAEATLQIALPGMPVSSRWLREMIARSAPLSPNALVWTDAVLDDDGMGASVTLARRDWLDGRLAAIRRGMPTAALTVVAGDRREFVHRETLFQAHMPRFLALIALAAILSIAAIHAGRPDRIARPASIAASSPPASSPPASSSPASSPRAGPAPIAPIPALAKPAKTDLELVGIAGRLPGDADVLVRTPWGKTTTMHLGDSLLGWKLVAIAPDRIALEKDGARAVVVLPAPE